MTVKHSHGVEPFRVVRYVHFAAKVYKDENTTRPSNELSPRLRLLILFSGRIKHKPYEKKRDMKRFWHNSIDEKKEGILKIKFLEQFYGKVFKQTLTKYLNPNFEEGNKIYTCISLWIQFFPNFRKAVYFNFSINFFLFNTSIFSPRVVLCFFLFHISRVIFNLRRRRAPMFDLSESTVTVESTWPQGLLRIYGALMVRAMAIFIEHILAECTADSFGPRTWAPRRSPRNCLMRRARKQGLGE